MTTGLSLRYVTVVAIHEDGQKDKQDGMFFDRNRLRAAETNNYPKIAPGFDLDSRRGKICLEQIFAPAPMG